MPSPGVSTVTRGAEIAAFTLVVVGDELEAESSEAHPVRVSVAMILTDKTARITVFFTPLTIMEAESWQTIKARPFSAKGIGVHAWALPGM